MTTEDRILELSYSLTTKEIAEIVGVTPRYVNAVIKKNQKTSLTLNNYLHAIEKGITDKRDLGLYFGVSRATLWRFEQKHNTKEVIGKYIYLKTGDIELVKDVFKKNSNADELAQLPNLRKITEDLTKILNALEPISRKTPHNKDLYKIISSALKILTQ